MSYMRITAAALLVCLLAACPGKPSTPDDGGVAGGSAGGAAGGAENDAGMGGGSGGVGGGGTAGSGGASGGGSGGGTMANTAPMFGALSPVTLAEGATSMVTLQATDAENDPLTFSLGASPPPFVSLTGNTLTVAPGFTHAGAHSALVKVSDGQLEASAMLTITVTNVNRPPVLMAISDTTVVAGTTASITLTATDPDGDAVTFSATGLPAYASLASGVISLMPGPNLVDSLTVTVTATDPSLATDSDAFLLTVTAPANLAPTLSMLAQVDAAGAAVSTGAMVASAPKLRAAVDDPENGQVRLEAEVIAAAASFTNTATHSGTLGAEGTVQLALPSLAAGSYKWQLRALDAAGNASAWASFASGATAFVVQAGAINGSITISGGSAVNTSMVTLDLVAAATAPATLTEMCFSNDGVTFTQCGAPVATRTWALAAGEGLRAAYVRVRDSNNTTVIFFDDIVVDVTPPQISSFAIANGAAAVLGADVVLSWAATDALSGLKAEEVSNDGLMFTAVVGSPENWALAQGEGTRTVTLRVVDVAGNIATATDTTIVDKTPPVIATQVLNGGAAWTNQLTASLTVSASDGAAGSGVTEICVAGAAAPGCQPFGTGTVAVTLLSGDGPKQVDVTVKDLAGHVSLSKPASLGLDTQAPALTSLTVNLNAAWSGSANVSVATTASDATSGLASIRCRTDSGALGPAAAYVTPFAHTLSGGEGMHTVSCLVLDAAGNSSPQLSDGIGLDTTGPTGTVIINAGNPQYTTSAMATLVLTPSDASSGVTHFCANLTGTAPASPADACFVPLAMTGFALGADGPKTVSVWFRDAALNVSAMPATDAITLDGTAPTVTVIGIQGGAAFTRLLSNTFDHSATETGSGLAQVCTGTTSPPLSCVPYVAAAPLSVAAGDGPKTGFLRVIDAAGNSSAIVTDTITLDQTPPTLSGVFVNLLAAYTTSVNVTVTSTASDANGVPQMQFSDDGNTFAAPTAYSAGKSYALPAGDGAKTVYVRVLDAAGNLSPVVSDSITLDATPPSVAISVNAGARYTTSATVSVALTPTEAGSGVYRHCVKEAAVAAAPPSAPGVADPCFVSYQASVSLTLAAQGDRRVYAWLLDNAGNLSLAPGTADIWFDSVAPSAPSAPSAVAGHRVLNVSWGASLDASSGISGYEVGVSQTSGGPYTFGAVVATLSSAVVLPNGVPQFVVIRSVDQAGNRSANTAQVSGTPRWPFSHQQRLPTANNLRGVAFRPTVNRWFVTGTDGALYSSDDAFTSSVRRDPMTDLDLEEVFVDSGGDVWVVGQLGHIARSTDDGVSFSVVTNTEAPLKHNLADLTFAGTGSGMFPPSWYVAVGASGTILRATVSFLSPTPSFAPVVSGTANNLSQVARCSSASGACAGGAVLIAVGAGGTILRSADNGATWAAIAAPSGYAAAQLNAVVAMPNTNTIYIGAVSPVGQGPLLRSLNGGLNFAEVVIPDFSDLDAINSLDAFGSDLWMGAAVPAAVLVNLNGTTRTNQASPSTGRLSRALVARSATEVMSAGDVGQLEYTSAPPTWAARSVGTGAIINGLCQPPAFSSILWQSGQSGWLAVTSTSGLLWAQQGAGVTSASLSSLSMVDTNGTLAGVFGFAVGTGGTIVKTTNGGTTWALDSDTGTVTTTLNSVSCRSVTACIAVGNSGASLVWNGTSWAVDLNGVTRDFNAVTTYQPVAGSVRAVAVGDTGLLRTLVATTWSTRPDISTNSFFGVAHKSDLLGTVIAVGSSGAIYKSTNHGQDFTARVSGTTQQLNAVANVPGTSTWYAAGANETALRSTDDGETWAPLLTTSSQSLNAIAVGATAGRVWLGGNSGATLFSSTSGQ